MANISHFTQTVNGVSTTYDIHDADAVPRSGTNALAGSIVPSTNNAYDLGSSNYRFKGGYFYNLWVGGLFGYLDSGIDINYSVGANLVLRGKNRPSEAGVFWLSADNGSNSTRMMGTPDGALTWGSKNVAMQEDVIPRSGGAVLTGGAFYRNVSNEYLNLGGATGNLVGGTIILYGPDYSPNSGQIQILPSLGGNNYKKLELQPDGTLTWDGQPIQYGSDRRLKQQIAEIDDKLLDAWQDVDLVQFKYNDAVDQKGKDKARLHTGYVVQQIDTACKSHNVDISQYGLYCHEEYPEETEEVEVEQADGTKTKETKVIREANEHYSLRYTEVYAVECMYLRRCIKRLTARIEQLTTRIEQLEKGNGTEASK